MSSDDSAPPTEGQIILNSRVDTLYTHAFREGKEGEGRFFNVITLDDRSQQVEMELTPRVRISFVFIKERNDINAVYISKHRFNKRYGWREDKKEEVRLAPMTLAKVIDLLKFLTELDLGGIHARRIRLADDSLPELDDATKRKIRTLLRKRRALQSSRSF